MVQTQLHIIASTDISGRKAETVAHDFVMNKDQSPQHAVFLILSGAFKKGLVRIGLLLEQNLLTRLALLCSVFFFFVCFF